MSPAKKLLDPFSPGPWTDDDGTGSIGSIVTADRQHQVGQAGQLVGDDLTQQIRRANARLMAASPELLAALERMCKLLETLMACIPWGKTWNTSKWLAELNEAPTQARLAIAKARGTTP